MPITYTPIDRTGVENGQAIYVDHLDRVYDKVDQIGDWLSRSTGLPGKIRLFTANATEASLLIPQTSTEPSVENRTAGDMWFTGGVLKFQTAAGADNTKTIAFTDSAITSLTVSGASTLSGAVSVGGASTFTGASTINNIAKIKTTNDSAFVVERETNESGTAPFFKVDTSTRVIEIRKDNSETTPTATLLFKSQAGDTTFQVIGANGNTTSTGSITAGSIVSNGTINSTGAISRGGVPYAAPTSLHTGGFTVNLGNGSSTISNGAQLPLVIIPYACKIRSCTIVTSETTASGSITITLEVRTNNTTYTTRTLGLTSPATALTLTNAATSNTVTYAITDNAEAVLNQDAVVRISVTGSTLKSAAIHFRVERTV